MAVEIFSALNLRAIWLEEVWTYAVICVDV